ncbi:DUF2459 domain-containing protein [Microvirga antarctica]|uniref:DUF2459 domain-containing protein n=1 Tax=Microvirga antarctica TaxID=2819233 RepID=UPI001B306952|nr:DUF2459 domain-containing protein [Microvirga antarctica]
MPDRRGPRRLLIAAASLILGVAAALLLSARPGNPTLYPPSRDATDILLVSNGYHSGLVLPVSRLAENAAREGMPAVAQLAQRFRHYDWIEIGWGDADFYRAPTVASLDWGLALTALLGRGSGSVLHVVGIEGAPETFFPGANLVRIAISPLGFDELARHLSMSFALNSDGVAEALGPGLYGPSLFYRARGHFSLLRVCNHWTADLLDAAGVPTVPLLSVLPSGLMVDLKWRSGLVPVSAAIK